MSVSKAEYPHLALVHAAVGAMSTMVIFPLGILGARAARLASRRWWIAHAIIQGVFGGGLLTASFVMGIFLVGHGKQWELGPNVHRMSGLVLFVFVWFQIFGGVALKAFASKRGGGKGLTIYGHHVAGWFHSIMGVGIVGLGLYQTYSGIEGMWLKEVKTPVPLWWYIVWGAFAGVIVVGYLFSLFYLPMQFRKEEADRAQLAASENAYEEKETVSPSDSSK